MASWKSLIWGHSHIQGGLSFQRSSQSSPTLLFLLKKTSRPKFKTSAAIFCEVRKHIFFWNCLQTTFQKYCSSFCANPVMETPASLLTAKRKTVTMMEVGGGKDKGRKTGRKDSGEESDKFPADSYLQAIPPAAEKPRPRPSFPFSPLY